MSASVPIRLRLLAHPLANLTGEERLLAVALALETGVSLAASMAVQWQLAGGEQTRIRLRPEDYLDVLRSHEAEHPGQVAMALAYWEGAAEDGRFATDPRLHAMRLGFYGRLEMLRLALDAQRAALAAVLPATHGETLEMVAMEETGTDLAVWGDRSTGRVYVALVEGLGATVGQAYAKRNPGVAADSVAALTNGLFRTGTVYRPVAAVTVIEIHDVSCEPAAAD